MSGFFTAEFGPIVGARFVGFIFATALWGVTCSQTWSYYRKSFNDHWALRSLVLFMWITDTVHEILLAASLYRLLILDFGNYEKLLIAPTTDSIAVLFNSLTALEAQGCGYIGCLKQLAAHVCSFFLFRIYSMSHKKFLLTGALGLPLLAQFALGVAWSKLSFRPITDILLNNITPLELSYYAIAAVGDTILVIVSCYLLQRSRSGFERSDSVINKLMLYIVNAGLLTSILAIATVIVVTIPSIDPAGLYFNMGRLYVNSMLAHLNVRDELRHSVGFDACEISRDISFGQHASITPDGAKMEMLSKHREDVELRVLHGL